MPWTDPVRTAVGAGDKLLIAGPAWIGDMVMAQSLYKLLSSRNPGVRIHVIAPPWSRPILDRMPEVSRAIELDAAHGDVAVGKRWKLGRRLRDRGYAQAIVLPRSLKAALAPFFAAVPVRTGYRGEWRFALINDIRPFDPGRLDQTVKRFIALGVPQEETELPPPPRPSLRTDEENLRVAMQRLGLTLATRPVALMPGAEYGPAKRWPADRFGALAARLAGAGLQVWILGSARERELGEEVRAVAGRGHVVNLCGRTTLLDAVDLLGAAAAAVTNDSGLMHIAAAVDTHVIGLYGSTSPRFTPPLTDRADILYRNLECSPCFRRECPLGHFNCMMEFSVDRVAAMTMTALDSRSPAGDGCR